MATGNTTENATNGCFYFSAFYIFTLTSCAPNFLFHHLDREFLFAVVLLVGIVVLTNVVLPLSSFNNTYVHFYILTLLKREKKEKKIKKIEMRII
jgi:hypothetical protein